MLDKVFETLNGSVDLKELIGNKGEKLIKDLIEVYLCININVYFLFNLIDVIKRHGLITLNLMYICTCTTCLGLHVLIVF